MPFYDFKCKDCGKSFTVFSSIKDKDKTVCPDCGSENVTQEFKSFNIGTSGSGGSSSGGCTSFG